MEALNAKFSSLYEKIIFNKEMIPVIKMERLQKIAAAFKKERDPIIAKVILTDLDEKYNAILRVYKEWAMGPRVVHETIMNEPVYVPEIIITRNVINRYLIAPELHNALQKN